MKIVEKLAVWFLWAFAIIYGIPAIIALSLIILSVYIAVGIIVEVVSLFLPEKKPFYF